MSELLGRVFTHMSNQRGLIAVWQMRRIGVSRDQIRCLTRELRRIHRGVYAGGGVDELGWYLAAALALGPGAAVSRLSALMLCDLRPFQPREVIDVTVPRGGGRSDRAGIVVHRSRDLERERRRGIPVTTPTQALRETPLKRHELHRALERVERANLRVDRSLLRRDIVELQRRVRGRTRSDTEAAFVALCRDHGLKLPLVNHVLNTFETDFHWPQARLVVEVDGFEHHREREAFARDRFRGLVHRAAGFEVVRVNADDVYDRAPLVVRALLAAAPSLYVGEDSSRRAP